jgi:hypothetical protein
MISNGQVVNTKVVELMKIYNFHFGKLLMWLCLNHSNFELQIEENWNNILKYHEKVMNMTFV